MNRRYRLSLFGCVFLLFSCSGMAIDDPHYILDPPNHNLRGHAENGSDDKPESDCNPEQMPNGKYEYKCVVHFFADYKALLDKIVELQDQLKSCQEHSGQANE